jgi:hypothetical protein
VTGRREIIYDTLTAFVSALSSEGIDRVALGLIDEKRGIEREPGVIIVDHLRVGEFIAYRGSTIYKYIARDEAITAAKTFLSAREIICVHRDRNIM